MPHRAICNSCGYVLYEDKELKTPSEILAQYDGYCPGCRRKLSLIPLNVEITPVKGFLNASNP